MGAAFSQFFFIPKPTITKETCPDQTGKVFIVTGGYSGIGFELCQILYARNAIVHIAGRSREKATKAIEGIKSATPASSGRLEFLAMDLADLSSVKSGVETFLIQNERLDVLINNAGIMLKGSNEPNFHELHFFTNCVGPSLLYKLLLPILTKTASTSAEGSVRVLWAGSVAVHVSSPKPGGMQVDESGRPKDEDQVMSYGASKTGNVFLSRAYAKDTPQNGVVHACFNPGNLNSDLQRHWRGLDISIMRNFLFFHAMYGAYTELWAATTPNLKTDQSGAYVYPWGRFGDLPAGVEAALKDGAEGGTGVATKFMSWCEAQTTPYL